MSWSRFFRNLKGPRMPENINFMLGQILSKQEAMEDKIDGINSRLDNTIMPAITDYNNWKNRLMGMCALLSAAAGIAANYAAGLFKK